MKGKTRKVQIDHLFLHTEHFGKDTDPTCLLIAGAMATAHFWTDAFCQTLAENGFFVIRYDHRDIGESSAIDWQTTPYSLLDLAKDAIGVLDAYGIKQAHFIGHSMGGFVCQWIALKFPKRVLSITAISAGPIGATPETDLPLSKEENTIQEKTWEIFLNRKDGASREAQIQSFLPIWRYLNGRFPLDEEMANAYTRDLILRSYHPIRAGNNHELVMRNLELEKYRDILQNIHVPTLIIHGEEDPLSLPRDGQALAHAISEVKLIMIPGMGHMLFHRELEMKIAKLLVNHMMSAI